MARILFVTNGHGEIAIADRIARDVRSLAPEIEIDHLPLVGESRAYFMNEVGPRQAMPSGGLIAMGNLSNILRDLRGGLLALTLAQRKFLVRVRGRYALAVAIGDAFALLMTLATRVPAVYVGTAKSVRVAPYGAFERRVLRRADVVFVRDEPTAERLRAQGVDARAPGNVIVDLFGERDDPRADAVTEGFDPLLAVFPGSRQSAYRDAQFLLDVVRRVAADRPGLGAVLSIAPLLDAARFARHLAQDGWEVEDSADVRMPFVLRDRGRALARAWRGEIGPLLARAALVIGQAGTANEAAAAAGVPVIAFERDRDRKTAWYRMRQHGLLGDALLVLPGDPVRAAAGVAALLDDAPRRARMGALGRERMGPAGGAQAIARTIVELT
ncbi:MAG TPA: hypothetical protein VMF11_02045 [Candidatus Baltobacteraceae bacterium]|nr:hypothetical protein [Candidatus Baltobacteraceae bacterium]